MTVLDVARLHSRAKVPMESTVRQADDPVEREIVDHEVTDLSKTKQHEPAAGLPIRQSDSPVSLDGGSAAGYDDAGNHDSVELDGGSPPAASPVDGGSSISEDESPMSIRIGRDGLMQAG